MKELTLKRRLNNYLYRGLGFRAILKMTLSNSRLNSKMELLIKKRVFRSVSSHFSVGTRLVKYWTLYWYHQARSSSSIYDALVGDHRAQSLE